MIEKLQQSLSKLKVGFLPSLLLIGVFLGGRSAGTFQYLEWQALDSFIRHQPPEAKDDRILLVTINEDTIRAVAGTYPIPDQQLANVLNILQRHQPRAIGLDLFRDLPVNPGSEALATAYQTMDNLMGIDKVLAPRVAPPSALPLERLGFVDAPIDQDGRQRRMLLGTQTPNGFRFSLALLLAEHYLSSEDVELENGILDPSTMRFGVAEFPRIDPNFGGYIRTNTGEGDIQMLLNFRNGPQAFESVTFQDVLSGNVEPKLIENRVVIIGVTTLSVQDHVPAAIPSVIDPKARWVYGIEIHAHAVSQILSATLDQRPLIGTWSDWVEFLWIIAWGLIGLAIAAYIRSPRYALLAIALSVVILVGLGYILLLIGWWTPVVPALMSLLFISLGLGIFYQYDRFVQAKIQAQLQAVAFLEQAKADLETQVSNRTAELQQSFVEMKQAKYVAERASRAKGQFLAKMSHELRTPLNAILGFSQMMAKDLDLSEANQKRTRLINQSGEHLLGVINDILSFAKLESGKQELREEVFSLGRLIETVEGLFRLRIEQKGLNFSITRSSMTSDTFIGDAQKLRQILINLLSNALKFTQNGSISLRVKTFPLQEKIHLQFEVEDTGEGIAKTELHKLFIPFEQTASGESSEMGTGLGLPISQQLANLMGGNIKVSSRVGQGSVFTFTSEIKVADSDRDSTVPSDVECELISSVEHSISPEIRNSSDSLSRESLQKSQAAITQALRGMELEWLQDLQDAATRLKGKRVFHLLEAIPVDQAPLAEYIGSLASNYDYDKIIDLVQSVLQDELA